jgi:hypothetical protein
MQPFPLKYEPTALLPQFTTRVRREVDTKDAINARNFEQWQTDGRYGTYDRPNLNEQRPFMDMNPTPSRTDQRKMSGAPRYEISDLKLEMNPYFDKYNIVDDPMNAARELTSVVYENKKDRGYKESSELLKRQFMNQFVSGDQLNQMTKLRLDAQLKMMPILNDTSVSYLDFRTKGPGEV